MPDSEEDVKLIGVYSSRELADQARRRAAEMPGFRDASAGFHVDRYTVDEDHWQEGYVTDTHADIVKQWQKDAELEEGRDVPS